MSAARTAVVLNDTRVDAHHGCTRVMRALQRLLAGAGFDVAAFAPAHADWRGDARVLRALESARLVVVNGEGTLHHDRPAGAALLAAPAFARARGIPSVLLNALWQDNGASAIAAVRGFDRVVVRDGRSAAQLLAAGVACTVVPDLSLYESFEAPAAAKRAGVGATDSVDRDDALALEALRRRHGGVPVPIQAPRGRARWLRAGLARSDLRAPATLVARLRERDAHWRARSVDDAAFLARLASLRLLVSGRFHACTLALLARTPFVAAPSNSHKIEALVEDAGLAPWRVAPSVAAIDVGRALAAGWEAHEPAAVAAYVARARAGADALFADLARLA
jgi:hypothetical protein